MRRLALFCVVGLAACAHAPVVAAVAPARSTPAPSLPSVRLVAHRPRHEHARFVGRVVGTAETVEIVEAARTAQADLKRRAAALGADVVQIDRVSAPPERAHGPVHRLVLLAGRAYRTRTN